MKLARLLLAAALGAALAHPAIAQQGMPASNILGYKVLSATSASSRVQLPQAPGQAGSAITIYNYGSFDAYYAKGSSTVAATVAGGTIVKAGTSVMDWVAPGQTHVAGITNGSDTASLLVYEGGGSIWLNLPPGAGGSIGSVTQGTVPWVVSNAGTFPVQAVLGAETTKVIGTVNQGTSPWVVSGTVQPGNTPNTVPWLVTANAGTTGGASTTGNIVANNTIAVVVKSGAGTLYGAQLYGIGAAPAYLKIYNATSATCGSGTPVKRLMIPAAGTAANGNGSNINFGSSGVAFGTGITYCVTTGIADADTAAPAAATFLVNLDWK